MDMIKFISLVKQFQVKNNITNACVTTTQYVYDSLRESGCNVKPKAVILIGVKGDDEFIVVVGHMLLQYKNNLLEVSSEFDDLKGKNYFDNIAELDNFLKNKNFPAEKIETIKKHAVKSLIPFLKIEEDMKNGKLYITNATYYNELADFMELKGGYDIKKKINKLLL